MSVAVTHVLRRRPILKTASAIVLTAFLSLVLQPLALAAHAPGAAANAPATTATPGDGAELAGALGAIHGQLGKLDRKLTRREAPGEEMAALRLLRQNLVGQDRRTLEGFARIGQMIRDKHLPAVILARHDRAVKTYQADMATLTADLDGIDQATDDGTRHLRTRQAIKYLEAKQLPHLRQKFDPNDLPTHPFLPNKKNVPKRSPSQFLKADLAPNPLVRLAALGDFKFDQLPGASDPAYLAATAEVVLTDAIKAQAQALNYDPVQIHNWVRNNVEWLPTWGATQDADVTLGSQRGNAMDIASLEIALLRAARIPARYVYGTIEVPAARFMNWAGGFTDINAAMDYASSGGIPVTGIVTAGQITKVQLEHVWVEAAIDFRPSRGAVNKSADTWVELDPSFKQYQDLPGLDVVKISGLDPNALAQSFASSGTVNTTEGWVQNLDPTVLTSAQTQAQTALTTYIQTNLTNPTVGDVIGGRKIIAANTTVLPASLPYRTVVTGVRYGSLPTGLENAMTFAFGVDLLGDPVNPMTFPWATLNNHKVTLSFKPATSADEQALQSLLPPGPITDPSQLPSSIPAYLIQVIPELALDGQTVMQGSAMTFGTDLTFFYGISRLNPGQSQTYTYNVTAGSYLSVGVAGGSVSPQRLQELKIKLTQTQTTLQSGDATAIGALTQEDVLGDRFYSGTLGYFTEYLTLAHVTGLSRHARHNLAMGYGTLGYEPKVQSLFGIPRAITPGGIGVNVRIGYVVASADGDPGNRRNLSVQVGLLSSALESSVPEQMFSTPTQVAQGVSAVKALQIASAQGQRIYHITQLNTAQVLPNLHLDAVAMDEITQGLAIGKEITVHTDRINVAGWVGEGYIILDPETGAGAYKIAGGTNGGFLSLPDFHTFVDFSSLTDFFKKLLSYLGPVLGLLKMEVAATVADIASALATLVDIATKCPDFWSAWLSAFAISFSVVGILSGIAIGIAFGLFWGILLSFIWEYVMIDTLIDRSVNYKCG